MIAGTLLGSFRFHDRIPWDDDVDLIVPMSAQPRLREALASLEPDFQLMSDVETGYQWKLYVASPITGSYLTCLSHRHCN